MPEEVEEGKKYDVRVIINSLSNERRNVLFKQQTEEEVQKIIAAVSDCFGVIRANSSLLLTGSDGLVVIANLDNVVFIEVQID
ncbi:MAG TPA: hypothetical protein VJ742_04765 [Nitrososphaera sp.]|nr:hypothetical protein [Nitrososphaera sp.]